MKEDAQHKPLASTSTYIHMHTHTHVHTYTPHEHTHMHACMNAPKQQNPRYSLSIPNHNQILLMPHDLRPSLRRTASSLASPTSGTP